MPTPDIARTQPVNVLLVEDNPGDARLVELALSEGGSGQFHVHHVERLGQALELLPGKQFDAILLDLSLPDSTELETLRQVHQVAPRVPVVVLSGLLDEELALEAVRQGAQDYLVKGQGDSYLVARAVRYAMERKHSEEALRQARDELEERVRERTQHLEAINRRLQDEVGQRQYAESVLRRERDFIAAVLDTVGALVLVLDTHGRIVQFNRACERLTGYRFDEVQGREFFRLFVPPDEAVGVDAVFQQLRDQGMPNEYENAWMTRSGERRQIAWSNTALRDERGGIEYIIATGIDVTERRQAEAQERQRMLGLAHTARLQTMGEMATELAHELNQPLAAISSYSEACIRLMQSEGADSDEVRSVLSDIHKQTQRAAETVRRIRSFARKETPQQAPVAVNDLVREMVDLTSVEMRWHDISLQLELSEDVPPVLADKILVEQVLVNLIRNAIDAMSEEEERCLTLRTTRNGQYETVVSVLDTGPGLSPDIEENLFEAFFTTKATGMGMGLSLSQSIIEAHGGRLWGRSRAAGGAEFGFTLPANRDS